MIAVGFGRQLESVHGEFYRVVVLFGNASLLGIRSGVSFADAYNPIFDPDA